MFALWYDIIICVEENYDLIWIEYLDDRNKILFSIAIIYCSGLIYCAIW